MSEPKINHHQILKIIPHRYPFLFIDGILESDENSVVGYKNITLSEPSVYWYSAEKPRLPQVIVAECMAQTGAVGILNLPVNRNKLILFAAVKNLRFHHAVYPGDRLVCRIEPVFMKTNLGRMRAQAHVLNQLIAEGEFTYAIAKKDSGLSSET